MTVNRQRHALLRPLGRLLGWLVRTTTRLVMVIALCASLLTAGLMTMSAAFFGLVSSIIEAVYDGPTVRRIAADDIAQRDRQLAQQADDLSRARTDIADRDRQLARHTDEIGNLRQTVVRQADDVARLDAERYITFNGERRLLREAVSDTTTEVTERVTRTAARNIASMPGEGIPVLGIAVVVAATAFELKDACATSEAMYQLDIAMNPEHAVADRPEVCGMRVPTGAEVWAAIVGSPAKIWDDMVGLYADLPRLWQVWDMIRATPGQFMALLRWIATFIPDLDLSGWLPDWDLNPFSDPPPVFDGVPPGL